MIPRDELYAQAQAIVHEALEVERDTRTHLIAGRCGDNAELRREVDWLLAAAEVDVDADDTLSTCVRETVESIEHEQRINVAAPSHYRLIECLGEGGMGVVWLAEREVGGVRQQVALKRLGLGLGDGVRHARFRKEQRILATLNHPNIAHLVDAGIDAGGEPFLAMEYVAGTRIDHWCDAHRLDLRARIQLLLKVCAAVSYAHGQLVIHRDLKPANILVDANGRPKLLDFGIASLQDTEGNATIGTRAMTPAYASPEQIEGKPLGTATDVYSLGVVLYELVAGARPFDHVGSDHARSIAIVSGEIVPPSRLVRTQPAPGDRSGAPAAAARRIPADIDAIALKALRREPAQRYASVAELADDLRLFLAARPVLARRGQRAYRVRRFLWRNRWPATAVLALFIVATGFTWRTMLAEREARLQAHTSDRVTEFLTSIFAATDANLNNSIRHDLSAREVLDAGSARIRHELSAEPRVRARLLESVGNAYRHMNDNNRAASLMREAADLNLSAEVDQPRDGARCLEQLANLLANGEFPASAAEDAARRSLALAQELMPAGSQQIANSVMVLSLAQNRAGNYAAAEASARKTQAMNLALRDAPDNRLVSSYNNLCIILANRGDYVGADLACSIGVPMYGAEGEGRSIGQAMTLSRHAQARAALFDAAGADAAMAQALDIARRAQGAQGPFTALFELRQAVILNDRGDHARAAAILERLLDTQATINGTDSGEYAAVRLEIARRRMLLGEFDAAIPALRELAAAAEQRYDADDPRTAQARMLLAQALLDSGNANTEAREMAAAANAAWLGKDDPGAPAALDAAATLAQWFAMQGDAASAQPLLARVTATDSRADLWTRARADLARGTLARARGDTAAELEAGRAAYERLRDKAGADHPQTVRVGMQLARRLRAAGESGAVDHTEARSRPRAHVDSPDTRDTASRSPVAGSDGAGDETS